MRVRLVAMTQSLIQTEEENPRPLTAEEHLIYIARVSNPDNQMNTMTSDRLIAYLLRQKTPHVSPFEQVHLTFEIKTSRAIAAQMLRHWSMRFQEFSQRYAVASEIEDVQLRQAPDKDRQSSGEVIDPKLDLPTYFAGKVATWEIPASEVIETYFEQGLQLYQALMDAGVAKECARMVLPLATTTTLYMTGDIRSYIFYLKQRLDPHAQMEHQWVANAIKETFVQLFPAVTLGLQHAGIWQKPESDEESLLH